MRPTRENDDPELLQEIPDVPKTSEAPRPLDLKQSLRIRDGLELSSPKSIENHVMQHIRAHKNRFMRICSN